MTTDKRKKQIAKAVNKHRENQKQISGRSQTSVMLTDDDKENMKLIKLNEKHVSNQGESISLALSEFVKKYDDE